MKLGKQVGLVHGHNVLDGDQLFSPKGGGAPNFWPMSVVANSFWPMSILATVAHLSYCWALVVRATAVH